MSNDAVASAPQSRADWRDGLANFPEYAQVAMRSPMFYPGLAIVAGILLLYWPLFVYLPGLWGGDDGYYSHGYLVPFLSGYLVYKAWPKLQEIEIKPVAWVLILLIPILWATYASRLVEMRSIMSLGLIGTLLIGIVFVAGTKALRYLTAPVLYLIFALPIWTSMINNYTNPLQLINTKIAFKMLDLFYDPHMDGTSIWIGNFTLDVGIPCSGLKLVLAITAFTLFFVLIGGLRWWANVLMFVMILPLCLFINSLRIAMIGVVGETQGAAAANTFHDWSGYIALLVCFFIIFKFARLLGWKN